MGSPLYDGIELTPAQEAGLRKLLEFAEDSFESREAHVRSNDVHEAIRQLRSNEKLKKRPDPVPLEKQARCVRDHCSCNCFGDDRSKCKRDCVTRRAAANTLSVVHTDLEPGLRSLLIDWPSHNWPREWARQMIDKLDAVARVPVPGA